MGEVANSDLDGFEGFGDRRLIVSIGVEIASCLQHLGVQILERQAPDGRTRGAGAWAHST